MDALSGALRVLRLTGAVFLDANFTAPWCLVSPKGHPFELPPEAPNTIFFHVITEGHCQARLTDGGETVDLGPGDLILLPRDDPHFLGSDVRLPATPADKVVQPVKRGGMLYIEHGGGGERTRLVCGFLSCDERLCGPMLESLPRILRVPLGEGPATTWLRALLESAKRESAEPRPGGDTVLSKMSELLFVEALRRYIEQLPPQQRGWFAALGDRFVGRALALMHEQPSREWTVDELAANVGLSRSSLAQRFTDYLGQPPMHYLTRWRLTVAAQRLRSEPISLARLAAESGYESEAAFNRAFKRALGETPAAWRRKAANQAAA